MVKYPNNIKKNYKPFSTHANRGMDLENLINLSNEYYLNTDIAVIYKKPTPITIRKMNKENKNEIKDAYFKSPSTLDYNGIYRGKYIEFDAKVTLSKTSFPKSNIKEHQIKHMEKIIKHGGICFLIIQINSLIYLLKGEDFQDFFAKNNRKSIPYDFFKDNAYLIKEEFSPRLNYLSIVDQIYFKGDNYDKEN